MFEQQLDPSSLYEYMNNNLDRFKEGLYKEYTVNEVKRDETVKEFIQRVGKMDEKYASIFTKAKQMTDHLEKTATMTVHNEH